MKQYFYTAHIFTNIYWNIFLHDIELYYHIQELDKLTEVEKIFWKWVTGYWIYRFQWKKVETLLIWKTKKLLP